MSTWSDIFTYLKDVGEYKAPFIIALITDLVRNAEEIYKGAGMGAIKKEYVMNALQAALSAVSFWKESTEEYKQLVLRLASLWIDVLVASYNSWGGWGKKVVLDFPSGTEI